MSKRFIRAQMDKAHADYMASASTRVEMTQDADGRWFVRCYNKQGHYIGGVSNITGYLVARSYVEAYSANPQQGE